MTREEAIEEVKNYENYPNGLSKECRDYIIKALEQEPCEDAVSRKDIYFKLTNGAYPNESIEQFIDRLVKELKALQPVTPIRPKGHWIGRKKIGFGEWADYVVPLKDGLVMDSCSCSECGEWLTGSDEYQCSGNFCPNCGAKMEEAEDGGK